MPVDAFRLGFVPGVTPAKWVRTWRERHRLPLELHQLEAADAPTALADDEVDVALLRPPVDPETVSAIPLYSEVTVVIAAKDHPLAALTPREEVEPADLLDEVFLVPQDDVYPDQEHVPGRVLEHRPATTADAITLVAAGTGLLIVPMSLARLHHRRDLIHRPLAGGPPVQVLLAWLTEHYNDEVEDFIGIVRGRTVNSTRGRPQHSGAPASTGRTPAAKRGAAHKGSAGKRGAAHKGSAAKRGNAKGSGSPRGAANGRSAAAPKGRSNAGGAKRSRPAGSKSRRRRRKR